VGVRGLRVLPALLLLVVGACGQDATLGTGGPEPSRCAGGADVVLYDTDVSYPTADEAVGRAQRANGLEDLTFTREADSEVWVAGGSAKPTAVVELSRPMGILSGSSAR
jgi:hypothetical protein